METRSQNKKTHTRRMSLAESRFKSVMWNIRKNRGKFGELEQRDISYNIKQIQDYGYNWFANHYLMDSIERLEKIVEKTI